MEKNNIDLLTEGLQSIMIPASFRGREYHLPASRRTPDEHFRLSHNTLMCFYREVRKQHVDVRLEMDKDFTCISPGYCVAACCVVTSAGVSDLYFGENKVLLSSSDAAKENPFQIAVNKAQDKAIYSEIFGLISRFYDENGKPVVYFDDEPDDDGATTETAPQNLNSVEEKELEDLGNYTMHMRDKNGKEGDVTLKNLNDKLLGFLAAGKDEDETSVKNREKIKRYMELKAKKESKAAS